MFSPAVTSYRPKCCITTESDARTRARGSERRLATADEHGALIGVVEAAEEFHERGLARPVAPDQSEGLAFADLQRAAGERPGRAVGVGEGHVAKLDPSRERTRVGSRPLLFALRGGEEGLEVGDVQHLLQGLHGLQDGALDRHPQPDGGGGEDGQVAEGRRAARGAHDDADEYRIKHQHGQERETRDAREAAERQAQVLLLEKPGGAFEPVRKGGADAEDPDFGVLSERSAGR